MRSQKVTERDRSFGRRLQRLRKKAGLTQETLSARTGLSTTFIGLIETGKRRPSLQSLSKIARVFGTKVKNLVNF